MSSFSLFGLSVLATVTLVSSGSRKLEIDRSRVVGVRIVRAIQWNMNRNKGLSSTRRNQME